MLYKELFNMTFRVYNCQMANIFPVFLSLLWKFYMKWFLQFYSSRKMTEVRGNFLYDSSFLGMESINQEQLTKKTCDVICSIKDLGHGKKLFLSHFFLQTLSQWQLFSRLLSSFGNLFIQIFHSHMSCDSVIPLKFFINQKIWIISKRPFRSIGLTNNQSVLEWISENILLKKHRFEQLTNCLFNQPFRWIVIDE